MKAKIRIGTLLAAILMVFGALFAQRAIPAQADGLTILKFGTMVGVPKALTGSQNPIRGINGGGLPWVINGAEGKLTATGKLDVSVTGLVLNPNDPDVIARGLAGQNPIAAFRAVVSCLTADGGVQNVTTDPFPATTGLAADGGGDAHIKAQVTLPKPCIAPIIFVTSPAGAWFASTGY